MDWWRNQTKDSKWWNQRWLFYSPNNATAYPLHVYWYSFCGLFCCHSITLSLTNVRLYLFLRWSLDVVHFLHNHSFYTITVSYYYMFIPTGLMMKGDVTWIILVVAFEFISLSSILNTVLPSTMTLFVVYFEHVFLVKNYKGSKYLICVFFEHISHTGHAWDVPLWEGAVKTCRAIK